MSLINCPCGFFADGPNARTDYRRHTCEHHVAEEVKESAATAWAGAVIVIMFFVLVSFICTQGWGRFT